MPKFVNSPLHHNPTTTHHTTLTHSHSNMTESRIGDEKSFVEKYESQVMRKFRKSNLELPSKRIGDEKNVEKYESQVMRKFRKSNLELLRIRV